VRPPVAHAGRTSRPTRVALDRRLTGPTGGRTIGGCRCGGAAPRMAAFCAAVVRPSVGPVCGRWRGPWCGRRWGPLCGRRWGRRCGLPCGPSCGPSMRLTGRPPPTARTGELPRRSPISGGQAAESRRGARGGGHSSSRGSAKSRRGAAGVRDAPDNRVHGGDRRRPGGARRPPPRRPPPAARPRRRPPPAARGARPPAAAWPARRRRVARVAAAADAPVGAASPPADAPAGRPRSAARSAADLPPRTRRHAPLHGGHAAGRRPDTAPLPWSRRVDRVLRTTLAGLTGAEHALYSPGTRPASSSPTRFC
jgi:hypothetical protein